ncbi:hypothetical protein EBR96_05395, partial [bacterium]|nr:hypothetical protein [bacterium]
VLGEAQITMGDLRAMQAGDVIVLNSTLDAPLKLVLGDSTELDVQPGVLDDRLCAQVILWHSAGIPISRPAPAVQAPVSSPQKAEPTFTPVSAPPPAPIQNASPSPTPTAPRTQEPPAMTLPVEVPAAAAAVMVASVPEPVAAVSPTNQADDLDAFGSFEDEHPAQHTEDHDDLFQDSDDFDFENDDDHDASTEASGSDSSATEDDFSFDDHFDNEDTQFGDEFELDETPKQSKSETPVATESDDDFSWDDLDDEL